MTGVLRFALLALALVGASGCATLGLGPKPVPVAGAPDTLAARSRRATAADTTGAGSRSAARAPAHPDTSRAGWRGAIADSFAARRDTSAIGHRATRQDSTLAARSIAEVSRHVDYLWVLRTALLRRSSIDSVVARARQIGVRGLLVQVVGRADAYYRSDLLPRPEALWNADRDFDPLAEILAGAHRAGIEVHAWVNCMLVWSAPHRPRDPRHVLNAHPEWVSQLRDGRRMSQLQAKDFKRLGVEGVFLAPAHPAVRRWVASVAHEIAERYAVDGIHLDYIRQPGAPVGYDRTTRARFALETGVDLERLDRLPPARRAAAAEAWMEFQREQVTAVVREVRDSLEAVKPGLTLSAAVIADTVTAERANAQRWRSWIRQGLLDRAYPMCYAPSVQKVMDQLLAMSREFGVTDRLVPGIAVYNTSLAAAVAKLRGARELGFPLLALYSYDSLFDQTPRWSSMRDLLNSSVEQP